MSKYFELKKEIEFNHPNDMKKIIEYLETVGTIHCTHKKLESLWYDFSETYSAGWLNPDDELLSDFATWLDDYEEE